MRIRVIAIVVLSISAFSASAESAGSVPRPIWPVGGISDAHYPEFRWTPVENAFGYQIRFVTPSFDQGRPPIKTKMPDCYHNTGVWPSDGIWWVHSTAEIQECRASGGSDIPGNGPKGCVRSCGISERDPNYRRQCLPLHALTGCEPVAALNGPEITGSPAVCAYNFSARGFPSPPPPPAGQPAHPYLRWITGRKKCNGEPFRYKWAVRAIFLGADGREQFGKWSGFVEFYYEEHAGKPVPLPRPLPPPMKNTPVQFLNRSGMKLYLYYFFAGRSGRLQRPQIRRSC